MKSVVLPFLSVDEILWCDHSNETSLAVLLHGTICFSIFYKKNFWIFLEFFYLALLGVSRLKINFFNRISVTIYLIWKNLDYCKPRID